MSLTAIRAPIYIISYGWSEASSRGPSMTGYASPVPGYASPVPGYASPGPSMPEAVLVLLCRRLILDLRCRRLILDLVCRRLY